MLSVVQSNGLLGVVSPVAPMIDGGLSDDNAPVAAERVHREAIRDDRPQADRLVALLRPELLTTLHWRLDAQFLLRSLGESPVPEH